MSERNEQNRCPLADLKDFQKRTVNYVFSQFYGEKQQTRFLVADEVGLGKTMVARGIIAKTVAHLQDKAARIDVIYICSNAAIAAQNIERLNVSKEAKFTYATRLTYLPKVVSSLRENKINFISLTPTTTFDHQRSRGGHMEERAIIFRILFDLPLAKGERREQLRKGMFNLLQATASRGGWKNHNTHLSADDLDADLAKAFRREIMDDSELYTLLKDVCARFSEVYKREDISWQDNELRYELIGKLRNKLASICLSALEPDLVILDEFQRFKSLLNGDDDAALLARALFERPDVRVLLLSATPYKMYTTDQEGDEDNHYRDFISTLAFLFNDPSKIEEIERYLLAMRIALQGAGIAKQAKNDLEQALLQVMCRTERASSTRDHNAMTKEVKRTTPLTVPDLHTAANVDAVALAINAADPMEYWKSTPYLLNFMKHYELRKKLDKDLAAPSDALRAALKQAKKQLLTKSSVERYQSIDAANPRMRMLFEDTLDKGLWQLLWMPPSLPYTRPAGVYRHKEQLTKTLVFSRWNAVPDAISTICSYEAERRMLGKTDIRYSPLRKKVPQLLRFSSGKDNRLTGMPVLAWMLPSPTLAQHIDPLAIALAHGDQPIPVSEIKAIVKAKCEELLMPLGAGEPDERVDERWYWAAPALLDAHAAYRLWCSSKTDWPVSSTDHETSDSFQEHIDLFLQMSAGEISLGARPHDLAEVLCEFALAAPGTCALRALKRVASDLDVQAPEILSAAVHIASGFRTLFNLPETIALLRGKGDDAYWRLTLQYGIDGNVQSVLDEYTHVLYESPGLQNGSAAQQVRSIAASMQSVLSLRTAQLQVDELTSVAGGFDIGKFNVRNRFALRFADIRSDDAQGHTRAETVKEAFNSPFRPFVLASTSIGQEGLDFHTWCHAVMHWNLPSNPVDFEQREGRVHRYKGHAVRKNIAERYGLSALNTANHSTDPWQSLFRQAANNRQPSQSELIPYWIFDEGSARVERRIPILPLSKESHKYMHLKQGLALYRLVFGQPRQEDLLFSIGKNWVSDAEGGNSLMISLEPPEVDPRDEKKLINK